MDSTESTEDGSPERDVVWITGSEHFRLIHELFDPASIKDERASGRSTRLALKYVEMCLKVAPGRVVVEDHFPSPDSTRSMIYIMGKLFDVIGIDYVVHRIPLNGFTPRPPGGKVRIAQAGDIFEVCALVPGLAQLP